MAKQKIKKRKQPNAEGLIVEINAEQTLSPSKFGTKTQEIKNWFSKIRTGIKTPFNEKVNIPKGVWSKCNQCNQIFSQNEVATNLFVCPGCNFHHRIASRDYMNILFDYKKHKMHFDNITPVDMLQFKDSQAYADRLQQAQKKTKLKDALRVATGTIGGYQSVVACMDFGFIGGSLGSVMGEKFCRGVGLAIKKKIPFIAICQSGGARMMESAFSLMQMPKTCASLHLLAEAKLPYIVILTDPTYGGVTASFGMLGDIHLAEPNARVGFAGPRVIKELLKKELPKNFQRSESLVEQGFIDRIVHRHQLKSEVAQLIELFSN